MSARHALTPTGAVFSLPEMNTPVGPSIVEVLSRNWRRISRDALIITVVLFAGTFLIPNQYSATAVVLPPAPDADMGGLFSAVPGAASLSRVFGIDAGSQTSLYLGILRSNTIRDSLISHFGLVRFYKAKDIERARKALASHTRIMLTDDGFVAVTVTEPKPKLAADLANAYMQDLDRFLRTNTHSSARLRREFLERRLDESRDRLATAEDTLRDYQIRKRMPAIGLDPDRASSAAADLVAERMSREVELGTVTSVSRVYNPRAEQLKNEIRQFDTELMKIPPAATEIGRLYRAVKIQEKILLVLTEEYERTRVLELKNIPTVDVVDMAQPPMHKSQPRRAILGVVILVLSITSLTLLTWMRERTAEHA
jgi:uncharacterized protein involved in exopolysaccharide biosynthesis